MDWHVVDLSGTFEVTSDISHYTKAKFLSEIGRTEAIQVRCTSKADAVCPTSATGFEVFFPAEKFAIFASSLPVTLCVDSSLKDDRTMMQRSQDVEWFCRQVIDKPESLHNFLLAFGPRRLPAAHGLMNAYSARTFRLTNSEGDASYCRFNFSFLTNGRLTKQQLLHCDESPSKATFVDDLKENIRNGEKMQFRVQLQTLTLAEAEFLDWNPLDQTKVWLRSHCPLMPFGLLTLHSIIDHGVANLYAENECAPGIEPILNPLEYPLPVYHSEQAINPAWYDIIAKAVARCFPKIRNTKYLNYELLCPNHDVIYPFVQIVKAASLMPTVFGVHRVEEKRFLQKVGCRRLEDPYWQPNLFWTSVLSDADRSRLAQRLANYLCAASSTTQREMMGQLVLIDPGLCKLVETTSRCSKMDSQAFVLLCRRDHCNQRGLGILISFQRGSRIK